MLKIAEISLPLDGGEEELRRLAAKRLRVKPQECVIIGDQIFTDIVGANLCGMKSVLLSPIEPEEGFTFKVRRHFERGLREKFSSRKEVLK